MFLLWMCKHKSAFHPPYVDLCGFRVCNIYPRNDTRFHTSLPVMEEVYISNKLYSISYKSSKSGRNVYFETDIVFFQKILQNLIFLLANSFKKTKICDTFCDTH